MQHRFGTAKPRRALVAKRRARGTVTIGLTSLLMISLSFLGMGVPLAQGDETGAQNDAVATQSPPVDTPAANGVGETPAAEAPEAPAVAKDAPVKKDTEVPVAAKTPAAATPVPSVAAPSKVTPTASTPSTKQSAVPKPTLPRDPPPAAAEGKTQPDVKARALADNPPSVNVTKTLVAPGPFNPNQNFTYRIQYSCSSLETACPNATLTDVIPGELAFVANTSTGNPSTITVTDQTLKVVFTSQVDANGTPGLIAGATGQLLLTVKFPAGTPDGTSANNCANITADGANDAQSCAAAQSLTTPTYGVSLDKNYVAPNTGNTPTSGIVGTNPTSTLDLSATVGGNQPAASVTVVDPDPTLTTNNNPFDSFNLTGFVSPLTLPAGVQAQIQVKSTAGYAIVGTYGNGQSVTLPGASGIAAAAVTGTKIVYTRADAQPIAAGTILDIKASVQLRENSRSTGNPVAPGTIRNQAAVTATYLGADDQTATDTANYTVIAQSPDTQATKTINPVSAQQNSGADVTMTVAGKNSGNVTASSMTVTDPDPSSSATPFSTFTFKNFTPLALPTGVTAKVEVLVGTTWTTVGTSLASGATPDLGTVSAASVQGVRYTYTGTITPGTTISNKFVTTLKNSSVTGALNKVNCATVSLTTEFGGGAVFDGACANFTVTAVSQSVTSGKSFAPTSATAQTDARTTVTLSGRNTSNVPATNFVIVDPGTGSGATFNSFDFVSFGSITAPAGTAWTVEVDNGTSWVATPGTFTTGQTPTLPASVTAAQVQGVRYTLATGSMPANGAFSTTNVLQLRDTLRSGGATINEGSVKNCLTVSSTGATDSTSCATFTINKIDAGTGTGISKNIAEGSVVQNSGATTNVTLNGRNGSNTPVATIVIEDRDGLGTPGGAFFNSFSFNGFNTATRPAGTTSLKVEYRQSNGTWAPVNTYSGTGNVTPSLPGGVSNADVSGVRFTWTGTFAPNATVQAVFNAKLMDGAAAGNVRNCFEQTYDGSLINPVTSGACDSIDIVAQTRKVDQAKKFVPDTGTLGQDPAATTTATLTVRNTSNTGIDSIVVTDPSAATSPFDQFNLTGFVSPTGMAGNVRVSVEVSTDAGSTWTAVATSIANGAAIPTPGNAADVNAVRLTYTATTGTTIPANSAAMSVGLKLVLRETVRGGTTPVAAAAIKNCFVTQGSAGTFTYTGDPCATFTPEAQSPGVSAGKTWLPGSGARDTLPSSILTIKGRNSGNVPVDSMVLQDPSIVVTPVALATNAFDAFNVTGLSGLVLPQGADQVQIDVLKADGTWQNGTPAATLPTGTAINTVALADIVGVRATFSNSTGGQLSVVTNSAQTGNVGINVTLRSALRSGGPINVPPAGSLEVLNQSNAVVVVDGTPSNPATADAKYTINSGTVKVAPKKTLFPAGASADVNPNQTLAFELQIKNTGDRNLVAPVVLDRFDPALLGYDASQAFPAGGYQFVPNGSTLTGTGLAVDTSAAGQVKFTFAPGDYIAPGQTAFIRVVLTTKPGLAAGTVVKNEYGITYDVTTNGAVKCEPASSSFVVDGTTYCGDSTQVKIVTSESMASIKKIKGDDVPFTNIPNPGGTCPNVGGFTYYPCIAHTQINGIFDYKLEVSNSGNVPIGKARAIDVLPHVGDTGVLLTGQQRGTQWTPTFISPVSVTGLPAGATFTLYYANTYTPSTAPLTNSGGAWGSDWSTTDFGADTRAIAIDVVTVDGTPIPPAGAFELNWKMKAPAVSPAVGSIAWNSFAFTGEPTSGSGWLLAAEPRKVGIDLANPSVAVEKKTSPATSNGTFSFTLSPVAPAVGGGTESVTTSSGAGTTAPWTNLTPGGTYRLTESATAGDAPSFEAGALTCVNGSSDVPTTPIAGGVEFVAPSNGVVVCSMTNAKRSIVTVQKTAVGGDGVFDFTLTGDGGSTVPVTTTNGAGSYTWGPNGLTPGSSYTLSETVKDGYVSTFTSCTGVEPTSQTDSSVTFTATAGANISCGFSNTKRPAISVKKTSVGGDGVFDFTLTGDGGSTVPVTTVAGAGSYTWGPAGLNPTGTYTLTETAKAGWVSTFKTCTGVEVASSTATSATFTATPGAAISCEFTNEKQPAISVVKKSVGGDGVFDFTLTGDGGSTVPVSTTAGAGSYSWGPAGLTPGGSYTLTETVQDGWSSVFTECTGVTPTSSTASSVTFTATPGAEISCGFTNTKKPSITVNKLTEGGDGAFDFTLTGDGGTVESVATTGGAGSFTWGPAGLTAGGTYTLSESVKGDWVSTFVTCTDTSETSAAEFDFTALVDPQVGATFTAPAGAQVSCVFSNTKRPVVMVSKTTVGETTGDFSFVLEGTGGSTKPVTVVDALGGATWGPEGLTPGSYTLSEDMTSTVDGWVSEFTTCTNVGESGNDATVGTALTGELVGVSLELSAGDVISCGFVNTKRPEITVEKTSVGGDGVFDFALTGAGGSEVDVTTTEGSGSFSWGPKGLTPGGEYTLTETVLDGWVSEFTECSGTEDAVAETTDDGDIAVTFTAVPGADVSCAFTNTKRPEITVDKTAVGGDGVFDFILTGDGGSEVPVSTTEGTGSHTWGPAGLTPGGTYTMTETVQDGWTSVFTECTGVEVTSSTESSATFTAVAGAEISCGFTNTKRPSVTVNKITDGGDETFDFTLTGDGGSEVPLSTEDGVGSYTWGPSGLTPGGTYTLSESVEGEWVSTFATCTDSSETSADPFTFAALLDPLVGATFTAPAGAQIECVFSNTKRPVVMVNKTTVGDETGDFSFVLQGTGGSTKPVAVVDGMGKATWGPEGLEPGAYTLTEDMTDTDDEWVSEFTSCTNLGESAEGATVGTSIDGKAGVSLDLAAGDVVSCNFINTKRPEISVEKTTVGGEGSFGFTLTGDGGSEVSVDTANGAGSHTWGPKGLTPGGTYTLTESADKEWEASFQSCSGTDDAVATTNVDGSISVVFTAVAGSDVNCEFTNTKIPDSGVLDNTPPTPKPTGPANPGNPGNSGNNPLPSTGAGPWTGIAVAGVIMAALGFLVLGAARRRRGDRLV